MTPAPDPDGSIAVIVNRLVDIEIIKKGIFPDDLKDRQQILNRVRSLNHLFAQKVISHHAKELLSNLQVDLIGPLKTEVLHQRGMPERIMEPPKLGQIIA